VNSRRNRLIFAAIMYALLVALSGIYGREIAAGVNYTTAENRPGLAWLSRHTVKLRAIHNVGQLGELDIEHLHHLASGGELEMTSVWRAGTLTRAGFLPPATVCSPADPVEGRAVRYGEWWSGRHPLVSAPLFLWRGMSSRCDAGWTVVVAGEQVVDFTFFHEEFKGAGESDEN